MGLKLDWQSTESYTCMSSLMRQDWAWEFVRRNPNLSERSDAMLRHAEIETHGSNFQHIRFKEVCPEIGHFGLLFF